MSGVNVYAQVRRSACDGKRANHRGRPETWLRGCSQMGVKGLWKVLEPAGRSVSSPEALAGQRVAIDASIWIYQFLRVTPPGPSHHSLVLAGLFRRLCKLLYFKVCPVLVFDGAAPTLKREATRERSLKRGAAEERYRRIARKIIAAQIHIAALKGDDDSGVQQGEGSTKRQSHRRYGGASGDRGDEDSFENLGFEGEQSESAAEEGEEAWAPSWLNDAYLAGLDVGSTEFKGLPPDVQQEVLLAKKEHILQQHLDLVRGDEHCIPALHFSNMQVEALVKRRKVSEHLERVKEGSTMNFEQDYLVQAGVRHASEQRIASDSTKRYVLVKNSGRAGGGWTIDAAIHPPEEQQKKLNLAKTAEGTDADFDNLFGQQSKEEEEGEEGTAFVINTLVGNLNQGAATGSATMAGPGAEEELSFKPELYLGGAPNQASISESSGGEGADRERTVATVAVRSDGATDADGASSIEPIRPLLSPETQTREERQPSSESDTDQEDMATFEEVAVPSPTERQPVETDYSSDHRRLIEQLQMDMESLRQQAGNPAHSTTIDAELLQDFRQLLTIMGIPWLVAPGEAEAQCAWLQSRGHVDAIITDDNDVFLFGGTRVYRHFFTQHQRITLFLARDIERELGLTRGALIVMALLLGSDYCVGVRGMGPVKSMQLVQILRSLPELEASSCDAWISTISRGLVEHKWPPSATASSAEAAQFLDKLSIQCALPDTHSLDERVPAAYLHPVVDDTSPEFRWQLLPDLTSLNQFLQTRLNWSAAECRQVLEPIIFRQMATPKPAQTTLDAFLAGRP